MDTEIILNRYEPINDNLLLILHDIQNNNPQNYLEEEDLDRVARYLNLTRGTVYGVVRYYTMFSLEPRGKNIIRLCVSPVCRLMGGLDMMEELKRILDIQEGETTEDGLFTLEHSECLGQCDKAPALLIGDDVYGDLTLAKLRDLILKKKEEQ